MKIKTERFGEIEVEERKILRFPQSIPGFTATQFTLLTIEEHHPFRWLQSVDAPSLAFVILDPLPYFKDYKPVVSNMDLTFLEMTAQSEALLFVICVIKDGPSITANLLAPVLINPKNNLGKQVILLNQDYPIRQPLHLYAKAEKAEAV